MFRTQFLKHLSLTSDTFFYIKSNIDLIQLYIWDKLGFPHLLISLYIYVIFALLSIYFIRLNISLMFFTPLTCLKRKYFNNFNPSICFYCDTTKHTMIALLSVTLGSTQSYLNTCLPPPTLLSNQPISLNTVSVPPLNNSIIIIVFYPYQMLCLSTSIISASVTCDASTIKCPHPLDRKST